MTRLRQKGFGGTNCLIDAGFAIAAYPAFVATSAGQACCDG